MSGLSGQASPGTHQSILLHKGFGAGTKNTLTATCSCALFEISLSIIFFLIIAVLNG
jgi:threonine/homoserine/homoserine lactone efflux protein